MSCDHISQPLKSCVLLHAGIYNVPRDILTSPPNTKSVIPSVKIGFLDDEFKLFIVKYKPCILMVIAHRDRLCPEKKPDDGYLLRFNFIMTVQNEGKKVAFMKHDEKKAGATFNLSEETLTKADNTNWIFDLLMVVEMLELKSIDKNCISNDDCKRKIDLYMSNMKSALPKEDIQYLSYILRSPRLQDTFTGRLPLERMLGIQDILSAVEINYSEVAKYLCKKSQNGPGEIPDVDINWLLNYVVHGHEEMELSHEDVIIQKYRAHVLGLDFYKTITSDYLVKNMNEDDIIMGILQVALLVQDEELFKKAAFAFLNSYHEISCSSNYKMYVESEGKLMRLIIHTIYIWVSQNDVYIPGWKLPSPPTTEL